MSNRMNILFSTMPVPARYCGVWRRTLLETLERRDVTTTVYWMQTGRWHADIRLPKARPDFSGVHTLAQCNSEQLRWLATQEGFAGVTQVEDGLSKETCTWYRIVDFQVPGTQPDAGLMQFDGDTLIETGVHAQYLEEWRRMPGSQGGTLALRRMEDGINGTPVMRLCLVAGNFVMLVRSRLTPWPSDTAAGTSLAQVISPDTRHLLDFEISFGRRTAAGWTIQHSTLPFLEGRSSTVRIKKISDELADVSIDEHRESWQVLEWAAPEQPR